VTIDTTSPVLVEPLVLDFLARGLSVEFEVTGGSMAPFVRDHDVVEVVPVEDGEVGIGDVVVWTRGDDRLVVHRVIAIGDGATRTRGDALRLRDGPVGPDRLIGKVTKITRNGSPSRWGLGMERRALGWFSRFGVLARVLRVGAWLSRRLSQSKS